MPSQLAELLSTHLSELGCRTPEPIRLRPVRRGQPGDLGTAVAYAAAGSGPAAERLAGELADRLRGAPGFAEVRTEAGYLTLTLTTDVLLDSVRRLLRPGAGATPTRALDGGWPAGLLPVALAHARCRNVARAARAHGVRPTLGAELTTTGSAVVDRDLTRALLVRLTADHPGGRGAAVALRDLATTYQDFYAGTRTAPRGAGPVTSKHRTHLALTEATAVALATGLASLGLHAPEHL
ncbi:DALR anticodon-binding domain-containing protein [Ruania zhangjianzhongii]|uniref:DALR anticodon-binding domain-containing protein n=1 Tax=Ruania zhangjianzhongii TaxID=2603206 RepID=UPI00143D2865|nr:DALR anticodon-binding domain-containing protein [Ruania zhangjianzhongii]